MELQLNIFEARKERDQGIERAVVHADQVNEGWSEKAYQFLKRFLSIHVGTFQAEEVRSYAAQMDFPLPPSARAWGAVIVRAAKEGLISGVGYKAVRNKKAHATPARVWIQSKKAS